MGTILMYPSRVPPLIGTRTAQHMLACHAASCILRQCNGALMKGDGKGRLRLRQCNSSPTGRERRSMQAAVHPRTSSSSAVQATVPSGRTRAIPVIWCGSLISTQNA